MTRLSTAHVTVITRQFLPRGNFFLDATPRGRMVHSDARDLAQCTSTWSY